MFVATKQEMVSEAQTRALNAPEANFRNGSGAATKWHETIHNMSFRPKDVEWACLLQKKIRNGSRGINSCIKCASTPVFAMCQVRLRNGMEPPKTRVLD